MTDVAQIIHAGLAAIKAVADAADVPDSVKIDRAYRKRAKEIGRLARKYAEAYRKAYSDGQVDTTREILAAARVAGFKAELEALGVKV